MTYQRIIRGILTGTFLLTTILHADAFKLNKLKLSKEDRPPVDYTAWADTADIPSEADGMKICYPATDAETGHATVAAEFPVSGMTPQQIFMAAMVYAAANFNPENEEGFLEYDYDGNRFAILLKSTQGTNNKETTYRRRLDIAASEEVLRIVASDITARYREKGIIPRTVELESLHPEANNRHKELLSEFSAINTAYLHAMAGYVASRTDIKAGDFSPLKAGRVMTGMTEDEVIIILGAPLETRRSADKHRWIYSDQTVVIFTDGKVTKFLEP